ncbi:MAG: glycosyltransferase family 4 protein, partial [Cellulomonadaceae bacterium]|nr:glycosyltransferase family 4 protein [Cellulomonadaceae bacterium]
MTGLRGRRTLRQRAPQHEARLRLVAAALAASAGERHPGSPPPHDASLADRIASVVDLADHDQVWLVLSTLSGVVAPHATVVEVVREARRAGGRAVTDRLAACPHRDGPVTVAAARVLVDVTQAVHTDLVTGIQRVALRTVQGWQAEHDLDPVTWTADGTTLRTLTDVEASRLRSPAGSPRPTPEVEPSLVIPWRATVLIPELADQPTRLAGLDAVVRHGASHSAMIGYDCVPLMSPETVREGFVPLFYATLGVTSRVDHVATISAAATLEYEGWRESSAAVGLPGPRITTVELPEVEVPCDEHDIAEATALLSCGRAALVLAVGSHEPRKNHLNLLHAAELCWGRG